MSYILIARTIMAKKRKRKKEIGFPWQNGSRLKVIIKNSTKWNWSSGDDNLVTRAWFWENPGLRVYNKKLLVLRMLTLLDYGDSLLTEPVYLYDPDRYRGSQRWTLLGWSAPFSRRRSVGYDILWPLPSLGDTYPFRRKMKREDDIFIKLLQYLSNSLALY